MLIQSSMKSIDAQLDRIEHQLDNAKRTSKELDQMLIKKHEGINMKRLPIDVKKNLDVLINNQETCLDNWVSRCAEQGAKDKYFEAKQDVLNLKSKLRGLGYSI
jgi:hypothetical protein